MKKLFIFVGSTFLLIFFLACPTFAQEGTPLRVMTLNLYHGGMASLQQIGEYIEQVQPDVVLLQEVDINTHREGVEAQHDRNFVSELGFYTKFFSAFGKSIDYSGGYYGLGLLSRYPIVRMERVLLPMQQAGREQRSLLKAVIELDNGDSVCVASTHLDLKAEERLPQVEFLNRVLRQGDMPVLVGGDFNATPQSNEIKTGMSEWMRAMADDAYTHPSDHPEVKIDYIFAYPRKAWQVRSAKVPPVQLSDHAPVVVEYELLTHK